MVPPETARSSIRSQVPGDVTLALSSLIRTTASVTNPLNIAESAAALTPPPRVSSTLAATVTVYAVALTCIAVVTTTCRGLVPDTAAALAVTPPVKVNWLAPAAPQRRAGRGGAGRRG